MEQLYFGGSPYTRWRQNLAENPSVCIHLESAMDVIILSGQAITIQHLAREVAERLAQPSHEKYGYGSHPDAYEHP